MRIEVLKSIKSAEEEYRSMISDAVTDKKKSIASAELEADNLVMKAQASAEEYRKQKLTEVRRQAEEKNRAIVADGQKQAAAITDRGRKNLIRAVDPLVSRWKEQMHA
ncbi:MAG: ATPase [Methanomicrobiales archaeon]|nr:ATPase [Methanomicrobiales archaeon]